MFDGYHGDMYDIDILSCGFHVLGVGGTLVVYSSSYLSMEIELGDGKGIDRLAMPKGMFTPSISDIFCPNFRIDFSVDT